jgi:hypothetical protein
VLDGQEDDPGSYQGPKYRELMALSHVFGLYEFLRTWRQRAGPDPVRGEIRQVRKQAEGDPYLKGNRPMREIMSASTAPSPPCRWLTPMKSMIRPPERMQQRQANSRHPTEVTSILRPIVAGWDTLGSTPSESGGSGKTLFYWVFRIPAKSGGEGGILRLGPMDLENCNENSVYGQPRWVVCTDSMYRSRRSSSADSRRW